MSIKQQIDHDLKQAMLAGDKILTETLRGLKSAILYVEVAKGSREQGLSDPEAIEVLGKEVKKRQESADLYAQGGNQEKQQAELAEKAVIEKYLPAQLAEDEVAKIVDEVIAQAGASDLKAMGQVISQVRAKTAGRADGAVIARLVKERLSQ